MRYVRAAAIVKEAMVHQSAAIVKEVMVHQSAAIVKEAMVHQSAAIAKEAMVHPGPPGWNLKRSTQTDRQKRARGTRRTERKDSQEEGYKEERCSAVTP